MTNEPRAAATSSPETAGASLDVSPRSTSRWPLPFCSTGDQIEDHARRKGESVEQIEKWLGSNLGY